MRAATQFTGTVKAGTTFTWFTHSWNPAEHVVWTVVPVTPGAGAAQIEWNTRTQRASATTVTYWIDVRNLSAVDVEVEGRFVVLN